MNVDQPDTFHILKTYEAGQRSHLKTYVNCLRCEQYQTGQRSHLKTYVFFLRCEKHRAVQRSHLKTYVNVFVVKKYYY